MSEREELEQDLTSREPASPKLLHLLTAVVEAANDWDSWPRDLPPALQQKLPRLIAKIRADVAEIRQIYERAEAQSSADQKLETQTRRGAPCQSLASRRLLNFMGSSDDEVAFDKPQGEHGHRPPGFRPGPGRYLPSGGELAKPHCKYCVGLCDGPRTSSAD